MPGFFEQAKQAMQMRNQVKKVQREIEEMRKEYSNAGVKVVVSGDMEITAFEISDKALLDPAREEKLVRTFTRKNHFNMFTC